MLHGIRKSKSYVAQELHGAKYSKVFMTCRDTLQCIHEPFGDAFYYGPERLSPRYENDEKARIASGFTESTFKTILDRIETEGVEGKRLFIKDIIHYLFPPNGAPPSIAPSLDRKERGVGTSPNGHTNGHINGVTSEPSNETTHGTNPITPFPYITEAEPGNPTVIPSEILGQFHFTFLIRHPRSSIPSYYRCTIPPLDKLTGFYNFMPSEAGYDELRRMFDYLRSIGQVGPGVATRSINSTEPNTDAVIHSNGATSGHAITNGTATTDSPPPTIDICVVDADDLLDDPKGIIEAYCNSVGIPYSPQMLNWNSEEDQQHAQAAFEKWHGFHEDAKNSCDLKPRAHKKQYKTPDEEDREWREKFGEVGARTVRETVDANVEHYEYLKQFALRV